MHLISMQQGARLQRDKTNTVGLDRSDVLKGVWKGDSDDKRFVHKKRTHQAFWGRLRY